LIVGQFEKTIPQGLRPTSISGLLRHDQSHPSDEDLWLGPRQVAPFYDGFKLTLCPSIRNLDFKSLWAFTELLLVVKEFTLNRCPFQ